MEIEHTSTVAAVMSCRRILEKASNKVKVFKMKNLCRVNFLCNRYSRLAFFCGIKRKDMKTSLKLKKKDHTFDGRNRCILTKNSPMNNR